MLKDIDDLVEEQGIGGLPTRFNKLDIEYATGKRTLKDRYLKDT